MIALLVMTDGRRDCIARTITSALEQLDGPISLRVIHDDSGDPSYRAWLEATFPTFRIIGHPDGRQGFGGAIANAWAYLRQQSGVRFVFHLEDDFVFHRPIDLLSMVMVLAHDTKLRQLALRRQPWNDDERAAGGIVEQNPADYREVQVGADVWLEHRRFFTTNPSLYPASLVLRTWPTGDHSEGIFSADLLADPAARCAFWGSRASGEWVEHIGHKRAGTGY